MLSLNSCFYLTDSSLKLISTHCKYFKALDASLTNFTDLGIIDFAKNCMELKVLILNGCTRITHTTIKQLHLIRPCLIPQITELSSSKTFQFLLQQIKD